MRAFRTKKMPFIHSHNFKGVNSNFDTIMELNKAMGDDDYRKGKNMAIDLIMSADDWPIGHMMPGQLTEKLACKDTTTFNFCLHSMQRDGFVMRVTQTMPSASMRVKFMHPSMDFALVFRLPPVSRNLTLRAMLTTLVAHSSRYYHRMMNSSELYDIVLREVRAQRSVPGSLTNAYHPMDHEEIQKARELQASEQFQPAMVQETSGPVLANEDDDLAELKRQNAELEARLKPNRKTSHEKPRPTPITRKLLPQVAKVFNFIEQHQAKQRGTLPNSLPRSVRA